MSSNSIVIRTDIRVGSKVSTPDGFGIVKRIFLDRDEKFTIKDDVYCLVIFNEPILTDEYGGSCCGGTYKLSQVELYKE